MIAGLDAGILLRRVFRFGIVGVLATLSYFLLMLLLIDVAHLSTRWSHVTATVLSLLVSYLGHHGYTFERSGDHSRYFARFCIVSAALFVCSSSFLWWATASGAMSRELAAAAIALSYPPLSFVLHWACSFRAVRRAAGPLARPALAEEA